MMKCFAKDRNENPCRNKAINDTRFCKCHQYVCDYTDEMLQQSRICSRCHMMCYMEDDGKICSKCRDRGKENRLAIRETVAMCKKEGCKFKQYDEHGYCQKHQICILIDEVKQRNKRLCVNYVRGCREELDLDYKTMRCDECLRQEREKDKQRREWAKQAHSEIAPTDNLVVTEKPCTVCCKILPLSMFEGMNGSITKTCKPCRDANKTQDERRDKDHRNKMARERVYYNYQKWAKMRNIPFAIEKEYLMNLVKEPCFYCGIVQDTGMNGVDRKDAKGVYEPSNCVSCCQMCNYIKGSDTVSNFMKKVEHILTYNDKISGCLYGELFTNHTQISYNQYRNASKYRKIEFQLSESEFHDIISRDCYICGKPNVPGVHSNGVDRFDSKIGYIYGNCRGCCHTCNFIKNNYTYQDIIQQFAKIYHHWHLKPSA